MHKGIDFLEENWPSMLFGFVTIESIALTVFPYFSTIDSRWRGVLVVFTGLFLAASGLGFRRRKKSYKQVEDKLRESEEQVQRFIQQHAVEKETWKKLIDRYQKSTLAVVVFALDKLAQECELVDLSGERVRNDVRLTVYCYDSAGCCFIPIARTSGHARYREFGRTRYSRDYGVIADGYDKGLSIFRVPGTAKNWKNCMIQDCNIPADFVEKMRMHSLVILAIRLEVGNKYPGVLVIESMELKDLPDDLNDKVTCAKWFKHVIALVEHVQDSHVKQRQLLPVGT
ncbi:hypothetical protein P4N68_09125 [Corynebacterium felinum]|uniref:hypothetical protein n=1 Tax=Corynebacterium felinum TaxID=131318 RepID=UPI0025B5BEC7|nr:hypothetical protein [Corynebacterium felinum]MDF5821235.1 hypothetical protein [Corynebacterium felinum]